MKKLLSILVALALLGIFAPITEATPSYARNMEKSCSDCHTVYPLLNRAGKKFKEAGKPLSQTEVAEGFKISSDAFSARINLRPIDKRFSKDSKKDLKGKDKQLKIRSMHEAEVFMTGRSGKLSYFIELESEDEWSGQGGFEVDLAMGYIGYHISRQINLFAGLASPFVYDGNNTVSRHKAIRKSWAAAGFVPGESQMLGLAGKWNKMTYIASLHGTDGDHEGHDANNIALRTAIDVTPELTIGGYFDKGRSYDSDAGYSAGSRTILYGVDARINFGDFSMSTLYGVKDVENADSDSVISAEALYSVTDDDGMPVITPVAQINRSTSGDITKVDGAFYIIYNISEPFRISGGVERTFSRTGYKNMETRTVISMDLAF